VHSYSGELPYVYDSVPVYLARRDVDFYLGEAREAAGRVLEIGCGTGRVLLPITRAGFEVFGVDASQEMLDRCAAKLTEEPADVQRRVRLRQGDARNFDLGEAFELVIAPFRVFQHQITTEDQLAFLATVARHLKPRGRFAFDVFNPNFAAMLAADGVEREDTPKTMLPDGRSFRRTGRVKRVRWMDQVSEVELIYYLSNELGEDDQRFVQSFDMRWFLKGELVLLLERGGFRVRAIYGDVDRSELRDKSPEMLLVADKAIATEPDARSQ
jgi:SAM-dependent methyltransferase